MLSTAVQQEMRKTTGERIQNAVEGALWQSGGEKSRVDVTSAGIPFHEECVSNVNCFALKTQLI